MGVMRRRRFRREEKVPDDVDSQQDVDDEGEEGGEEDGDDDDDDDASPTTTISAMGLPSSSTENQFDKAKAIGEEVIKKVPSKFNLSWRIAFVTTDSPAISHVEE